MERAVRERPGIPGPAGGAAAPAAAGAGRRAVLRVAAAAAAVAALAVAGRQAAEVVPRFAAWVDSLGVWGPVVFIAGYALAVVAFVPGSLLTLAAGAVFGIVEGTAYVFVAAVLGSTAAFLVARHLARGMVERRLGRDPRLAAIDRAVGERGFVVVLLLRLSPVFPFTLLNYALGLTRVRLRDYVLAAVGMLPGTLLYVYSGRLVGDLAALASGAPRPRGAGDEAVLVLGLLATVAATVVLTRTARRALAEATGG